MTFDRIMVFLLALPYVWDGLSKAVNADRDREAARAHKYGPKS